MAGNSLAAARTASGTLTASTVDLVFLTGIGNGVSVTNVNGSAPIYFTVDTPGGACKPPTTYAASVGSVGVFCAASVIGQTVSTKLDAQSGAIVQLISSGTPTYTVALQ
jgi:hypothetical protein